MSTPSGIGRRIGLGLIGLYQRFISPMMAPRCRFMPSCSEYAREAITRYGLLMGSAKALWRLLRCNPLHPGGCDPLR